MPEVRQYAGAESGQKRDDEVIQQPGTWTVEWHKEVKIEDSDTE